MFHQNFSSLFGSSSEQPNPLFSLVNSFETLQISKPFNQKKDEYLRTIRSQKRKHYLHAKRMGAFSLESLSNELDNIENAPNLQDHIDQCTKQAYSLDQLDEIIQAIHSNDLFRQYFAVIGLRKLLSTESFPPIQQVIDAGTLPKLVEFMQREDEPKLQLEAAWTISNLASGTTEQTQRILDHGAIPALVRLLGLSDNELKEQAVWALGNIAGDNPKFRDFVIQSGVVHPIIKMIEEAFAEGNQVLIKNGTWALQNLCRGKPKPHFYAVKDTIPVFASVIMSQEDVDTLADAAIALSYLSDGAESSEGAQMVFNTGVVPFLVKFLDHRYPLLANSCMKTIGNVLTGPNELTNIVLEIPGIIEGIFGLLGNSKKVIRREAAWILSNIAAGTPQHLEYLLPACYLDRIFDIYAKEPAPEVKKEVVWILGNSQQTADERQLYILLERGIIQRLSSIIEDEGDRKSQEVALTGIQKILSRTSYPEGYSFEKCHSILEQNTCAMQMIQKLAGSLDSELAILAADILGYGEIDEELDGEIMNGNEANFDFQQEAFNLKQG